MGVRFPLPLAKQINVTKRAALAVMIVALWIAGIALMLRRNANRSEAQQLAEVALRLQPATFYYIIERDGQQIGAASSALDTTAKTLVAEEYFVGDYPAPGGKSVERTSARWQTRLTRGFRLVGLSIDVARQTRPFSVSASVAEDTTLHASEPRGRGDISRRATASLRRFSLRHWHRSCSCSAVPTRSGASRHCRCSIQ